jgi:predicted O-methyltransferase YrrM
MRILRKAVRSIQRRAVKLVLPNPRTGHGEYSMIYDTLNTWGGPSDYLIDLALRAAQEAWHTELPDLSGRVAADGNDFTRIWPGEHYRLLAALVKLLQPQSVIEVGTFRGLSALALKRFLPADGKINTFDVVPWDSIRETCLHPEDFEDDRLRQQIGDLSDAAVFELHRSLIQQTELLFVDGPKDGVFERKLLQQLETVDFHKPLLLVMDDIRFWNMLATWQDIARPKLDLTSFGHWSGTGLVEWHSGTNSEKLKH